MQLVLLCFYCSCRSGALTTARTRLCTFSTIDATIESLAAGIDCAKVPRSSSHILSPSCAAAEVLQHARVSQEPAQLEPSVEGVCSCQDGRAGAAHLLQVKSLELLRNVPACNGMASAGFTADLKACVRRSARAGSLSNRFQVCVIPWESLE